MADWSQIILQIKDEILFKLFANHKPNGEFPTYAHTHQGEYFYIGQSPFVTAHVLYFLSGVNDVRLNNTIQRSIHFLENIDYTGKRIYKFWYGNTYGTAFPDLPFDLDDTSVVNQAFLLFNRKNVDIKPVLNNTDRNGFYYTWLKPSFKTLLHDISYMRVYAEYLKTFRIFLKNKNGLAMAEYDDSEIIIRMNIYIMLALTRQNQQIADTFFPFEPDEVEAELSKSLHYDNITMYYLTLAKFQKHTAFFSENDMVRLASAMKLYLNSVKRINDVPSIIAIYFSLACISQLNKKDVEDFLDLTNHINWKKIDAFKMCVGNKKFKYFHEYYSADFTYAMALNLIDYIDKFYISAINVS